MKSLGQNPTDEEIFGLQARVDTDGSGNIDFQVMSPARRGEKGKLSQETGAERRERET